MAACADDYGDDWGSRPPAGDINEVVQMLSNYVNPYADTGEEDELLAALAWVVRHPTEYAWGAVDFADTLGRASWSGHERATAVMCKLLPVLYAELTPRLARDLSGIVDNVFCGGNAVCARLLLELPPPFRVDLLGDNGSLLGSVLESGSGCCEVVLEQEGVVDFLCEHPDVRLGMLRTGVSECNAAGVRVLAGHAGLPGLDLVSPGASAVASALSRCGDVEVGEGLVGGGGCVSVGWMREVSMGAALWGKREMLEWSMGWHRDHGGGGGVSSVGSAALVEACRGSGGVGCFEYLMGLGGGECVDLGYGEWGAFRACAGGEVYVDRRVDVLLGVRGGGVPVSVVEGAGVDVGRRRDAYWGGRCRGDLVMWRVGARGGKGVRGQ